MNPDGKIMRFLDSLGDLFLLNIMFLVCCIPVFTIGAATTALYYNTLKMAENRAGYVYKDFLKSFKQNFKQATIIWMILLLLGAVLVADMLLASGFGDAMGSVIALTALVIGVFLIITGIYVFPLLARFDNTVFKSMKNALIIAVRHLPSTIAIVAIHSLPFLVAFVSLEMLIKGLPVILLFVASILAYFESKLFTRVFSNYYPKETVYEYAKHSKGGMMRWRRMQR